MSVLNSTYDAEVFRPMEYSGQLGCWCRGFHVSYSELDSILSGIIAFAEIEKDCQACVVESCRGKL
jgi:hypothetical protein